MQANFRNNLPRLIIFLFALSFYSCRSYNQNIMFRNTTDVNMDKLRQSLVNVERNYIIQPNDYLDVRVYTNKGERILDPNGELPFGVPGGGVGGVNRPSIGSQGNQGNRGGGQNNQFGNSQFLVQHDGIVKLPIVGNVKITGLTLLQADSLLQTLYEKSYYVDPFVTTQVTNNRVFVLGSPGGQVIQMYNDNMNLLEVIAMAGGTGGGAGGQATFGRANKIKIIRDYMNHDPIVQVVDLTTIEGLKRASLHIEPNDVIYIEPNQRLFFEVFRDIAPIVNTVLGTTTAIITTIIVLNQINNQPR